MANPAPEVPDAGAIRAAAGSSGRLAVRVVPGARVETLELAEQGVRVKVRARPHGGQANEAVLALLAAALQVPASRLQMLRGATGRSKLVQLPPADGDR